MVAATTTRDPDRTRHTLLEHAFDEMYEAGFQAASLDRILAATGVTKGALYHHFRSKMELGYAVVDEVIARWVRDRWVQPLARSGDPIDRIREAITANVSWAVENGYLSKGCPLNNLAIEMSSRDEGFRIRIEAVFKTWRDAFAFALRRGQQEGTVRGDIDPEQTGLLILATLEGIHGLVKNNPQLEFAEGQMRTFFLFLESLRPPRQSAA